jgi:hypothetical protein
VSEVPQNSWTILVSPEVSPWNFQRTHRQYNSTKDNSISQVRKAAENIVQESLCSQAERGSKAQTIYTHVSKCQNNKIKGERKKKLRDK